MDWPVAAGISLYVGDDFAVKTNTHLANQRKKAYTERTIKQAQGAHHY